MVTIPDSATNGKLLVDEYLMQVICGYTLVTIIAKALRRRNINNIQTTVSRVKGDLGHRNGRY